MNWKKFVLRDQFKCVFFIFSGEEQGVIGGKDFKGRDRDKLFTCSI